ncbi:MAG: putative ABC transporter permease [Bilifractor sp.]
MQISKLFVEFIFYSFLGWLWESFYCTVKEKHWQDRGFLFGPICPIYGSCVVAGIIVFHILQSSHIRTRDIPVVFLFLISMVVSAIAEYGTSWVLEKRFHARWWDYSRVPLNLNGRICLPVSLCFGAVGVFIIRYLLPWVSGLHSVLPALFYEILGLVFAGFFGADIALTETALSSLLQNIEDFKTEFNEKAEERYEKIAAVPEDVKNAVESKASVLRRAGKLSAGQRHVLVNIQRFMNRKEEHYDEKHGNMHPGQRLKEAVLNLKNEKRED